jgi:hypothetical protein
MLGLALMACGSDEEGGQVPAGPVEVRPAGLFSGFDDGSATYKVPATLANVAAGTTVKWTVADADLATVEIETPSAGVKATPALSHHAIVTTKKAGKTTLKATADGKTYSIPLTITQYAVGARDTGNDLYQEDRSSGPGGEASTKALGCIGCHGAKGTARHSPSEIGGFDDATILKTIATAERPGGKGLANGGNHKYVLDDKEKEAIMARLRSLEPVEFPE